MIWGDNTSGNAGEIGDTFSHLYTAPGIYELYIIQEDIVEGGTRCSRIFPDTSDALLTKRKIIVVVNPTPDVELAADPIIVCPDEIINFTATMDARYSRITWITGDGDTIKEPDAANNTLSHSYSQAGIYSVIVAPEYDELPRCWAQDTIEVTVESVVADFTIDSSARPEFCFSDASIFSSTVTGEKDYDWTFEDEEPIPGQGIGVDSFVWYNWENRKGDWEVCLTVTTERGCTDTKCRTISNNTIRVLKPYNVFTPDGDPTNNTFIIDGESVAEFNIKIFNRWGERVFESNDINNSWNGKVNNTGTECPSGTYFYIINYKFDFGEENDGQGPIEGSVDLIR